MNLETLVQMLAKTHQSLQQQTIQSINLSLVVRNWVFGYYIFEFEQKGSDRSEYGSRLLFTIVSQLKKAGISGCSLSNLKSFRKFYTTYPEIGQTLSDQLNDEISLSQLSNQFQLSWSHHQTLMSLSTANERSLVVQ